MATKRKSTPWDRAIKAAERNGMYRHGTPLRGAFILGWLLGYKTGRREPRRKRCS
jgi:hypothetical protein